MLDINVTCNHLGNKCVQLLGMHALSGCDTTSHPRGKGKITALNLLAGDFQGLDDVLGKVDISRADLMNAVKPFFVSLYGQIPDTSMEAARFRIYTKNKKSSKVKALPPTSPNLLLHGLRAHLQVLQLWKAADQHSPPDSSKDITQFGWRIRDGILIPAVSESDPAPRDLIDVVKYQCMILGRKCSTEACGCHKEHLSCMSYCNCGGDLASSNPFTKRESVDVENGETPEDNDDDLDNDDQDEFQNDEWQ